MLNIAGAKFCDEITLFEPDANENIPSGRQGEDEMTKGHPRRRPECENEASVDGMSQPTIQQWRRKLGLLRYSTEETCEALRNAKELKMANEECAQKHHCPTSERNETHDNCSSRVGQIPDYLRHWLPLPH